MKQSYSIQWIATLLAGVKLSDVVIFGARDTASLAHFYLRHDSPFKVVAFTTHREFLPEGQRFENCPVVPFDSLVVEYPPHQVKAFAPMTYRRMNRDRAEVYQSLKELGYQMISYVSSRASIFANSAIGDNCFILENATVQPFATIGANVVVWSGALIAHHCQIRDHVFIAPRAVVLGHCEVGEYCFLGANSTIRNHVVLKEGTFVGMGAGVTHDTDPWSVWCTPAAECRGESSAQRLY